MSMLSENFHLFDLLYVCDPKVRSLNWKAPLDQTFVNTQTLKDIDRWKPYEKRSPDMAHSVRPHCPRSSRL